MNEYDSYDYEYDRVVKKHETWAQKVKKSVVARVAAAAIAVGITGAVGAEVIQSSHNNPDNHDTEPPKPTVIPGSAPTLEPTIQVTPEATLQFHEPTPIPEAHKESKEISIVYGANGLPVSSTTPDGTVTKYDHTQMSKLRAKAMSGNMPVFISYAWIAAGDTKTPTPSGEKDHVDHVMTKEQLVRKHVTIVNGEYTDLEIKESAFTPDGPLAQYSEQGTRKLVIVLVDGPFVNQLFTHANRYAGVREQLPPEPTDTEAKAYRADQLKSINETLAEQQEYYRKALAKGDVASAEGLMTGMMYYQMLARRMESGSLEDVKMDMLLNSKDETPALGLHYEPFSTQRGTAYIYIAVGKASDEYRSGKHRNGYLYFGADGKVHQQISEEFTTTGFGGGLAGSRDYPDPATYEPRVNNAEGYKVDPDMSWVFRHETEHDVLQGQGSESDTEEGTRIALSNAHRAWITQGDDRGYPFVLKGWNSLAEKQQGQKPYIIHTGDTKPATPPPVYGA